MGHAQSGIVHESIPFYITSESLILSVFQSPVKKKITGQARNLSLRLKETSRKNFGNHLASYDTKWYSYLFVNKRSKMTAGNVKILKSDYLPFLEEIKGKIKSARIQAYRKANKELILLYLELGERIVEKQEQLGWGKGIVEKLSNDLKKEFPTQTGYSAQNLWYMRQFYLTYKDFPNLQQVVGEIPWGQNLVIMSRVKRSNSPVPLMPWDSV